jgi:hypothetical protein
MTEQEQPSTTDDPPRIPAREWTDDEWLAVMRQFPPDTDSAQAEQWIAERRQT